MASLSNSIFENKEAGYWDFKNVYSIGIHKIVDYPATMVPDMQHELIQILVNHDRSIANILDPFHGSGVTLVESKSLGLQPYGIDINPLAHLITKVKLEGVNKGALKRSIRKVEAEINNLNIKFKIHQFKNVKKWFRDDVIRDLSKLKCIIESEKVVNIRRYYWVCLINIIKRYSNTRTTTFKLHIKTDEDILNMENKVFEDFINTINNSYHYLPNYSRKNKYELKLGDSIEVLKKCKSEIFDLICTSPPYGDNATTVTYGQYSMLPIYWIKLEDMDINECDLKLIDNYSSIDTLSMGGKKKRKSNIESIVVNNFLESIDKPKRKKVENFFVDYQDALIELTRVLKIDKYIIITLGNRRVDNKIVPLVEYTKKFFESKGFELITDLKRDIPYKRMPKKVSSVNNKAVKSMNEEHILIAKKR